MPFRRSSGVLLHPTSLPGRFGIGDLGPSAFAFIDLLASAGQRLWQVLPLGPTGYGDSPYQSFSAFAGNPLLISLDVLVEDGLLDRSETGGWPAFVPAASTTRASSLIDEPCGHASWSASTPVNRRSAIASIGSAPQRRAGWTTLRLFMAVKDAHGQVAWTEWEAGHRRARSSGRGAVVDAPGARDSALQADAVSVLRSMGARCERTVAARSIDVLGDLPIFVAHDSADVWSRRELFRLDANGRPTVVAGVPPDYFSATGQLWGNPHYDWDAHRRRAAMRGGSIGCGRC